MLISTIAVDVLSIFARPLSGKHFLSHFQSLIESRFLAGLSFVR